ncbi:MscL family protein [Gordonia sp. (in: high G+C Gram-positive bacteria)]|uniref:large conductance mechanosensitive channel protein MscL n=1 Tax=Gordonia sp. (in: high G+C Gram-positive bacteria) TaxID=84139 RepID=UPI003C723478
MLKGFKEFLLRGNVVELATAVIIGAAFTAIVTAFTDKIINPLIATIPSGDCGGAPAAADAPPQAAQICGFGFEAKSGDASTFLDFGAVISAFINFVIVAAVVYFLIIVPYNKLQELRGIGEDADEDPDREVVLLTQIRNALAPEAKAREDAEAAEKEAEEKSAKEAAERAAQPQVQQFVDDPGAPGYGDRTHTMTIPPQAEQQAPHQSSPQQPSPQQQAPQQGGQHYGQQQPYQGFTPPQGPPTGGFPTPQPAPGEYPPPGNLPPGQYAPGQYPPPGQNPPPGQGSGDAPRHSR